MKSRALALALGAMVLPTGAEAAKLVAGPMSVENGHAECVVSYHGAQKGVGVTITVFDPRGLVAGFRTVKMGPSNRIAWADAACPDTAAGPTCYAACTAVFAVPKEDVAMSFCSYAEINGGALCAPGK